MKFRFLNIEIMPTDLNGKMEWQEADKACRDGWRLPSIQELNFFSLLHNLKAGSFLFDSEENFSDGYYWSSEETKETSKKNVDKDGRSRYAWFVDLNSRNSSNNKKSNKLRVRLVRDI